MAFKLPGRRPEPSDAAPAWKDHAGFERLVREHFTTVFAVALARLRHREAAEDVAQETFVRALLQFDPRRGRRQFGPWIVCVARNLATDWLRRRQTASRVLGLVPLDDAPGAANMPDKAEPAPARLERRQDADALGAALDKLDEEQREVILLHFMENLSKRDIAQRLGVHPSTVGRQIEKGLAQLRGSLESMLRASPATKAPAAKTVGRTLALVAAVSALTTSARAEFLASTAFQQGMAAIPTGSLISAASAGAEGAILMGKGKLVAVVAGLIAVAGVGGYVYNERKAPPRVSASVAPAPVAMTTPPLTALPPLPPGWTLKVKPASGPRSFGSMSQNGVQSCRYNPMTIQDALSGGWFTPARQVDPRVAAIPATLDFALVAAPGATKQQFDAVLRVELQRAFGFRAVTERRKVPSLVLRAPRGVPKSFQPATEMGGSSRKNSSGGMDFKGLPFDMFVSNIALNRSMPVFNETGIAGRFNFSAPAEYFEDPQLKKLGLEVVHEDRDAEVASFYPAN